MELFTYKGQQVQLIPKGIKHCYFRAKPDGTITVTYNKNIDKHNILELLDKNWKSLAERLAQVINVEKYQQTLEHGSIIFYLGKQYNLEIISNNYPRVELAENTIYLYTPNNDFIIKSKIFNKWYLLRANTILSEHYQQYVTKVAHWNIEQPKLKFRKMTKRWGSFNKKTNTITLNVHLVKTSSDLINYVIAHELCHIIYFNHSKDFYNLLNVLHPTWKNNKKELNNYANQCIA